jgi:hypothetical protein
MIADGTNLSWRLWINVNLLDTGKSLSFNGKPKAPAWTASNNNDVMGMAAANVTLFDAGAFGLPLNAIPFN